ncbi:TetR/AcrR family transcriptional regulator [Pedobacter sp.]|jgi:TetR/AcrR family transcriptional repressor of multidrug resistance operon|uniref:TetR/AcrR family transcriptional regulator n=1 Tax=Pedobacter sp. TaxID=1411316 RepID=UPI002CF138D1|nr:TetR/AcrR family transcriptional regulator [Pedobacter sp.]HWW38845.1 TetR/AcrR family transcriptional regulator [Pedobacter sp.]
MNVQLENSSKRDAILNSTLELVKSHGFHGAPMSQIAKNANVAAGTIYHYFDSKETLIIELYIRTKERLSDAMLKGDDETQSYKDRFFRFMRNNYNFYVENESSMLFLEQYINSPFAKNYPEKDSDLFTNKIIPFFELGIQSNYFKDIDPRLLGPTIRGTLVAAASFRLSEHMVYSEEDINTVIQIIWDGIKRQ